MEIEPKLEITLPTVIHDIAAKKVQEISKEEKLTRDRLKELRAGVSKRFKTVF